MPEATDAPDPNAARRSVAPGLRIRLTGGRSVQMGVWNDGAEWLPERLPAHPPCGSAARRRPALTTPEAP